MNYGAGKTLPSMVICTSQLTSYTAQYSFDQQTALNDIILPSIVDDQIFSLRISSRVRSAMEFLGDNNAKPGNYRDTLMNLPSRKYISEPYFAKLVHLPASRFQLGSFSGYLTYGGYYDGYKH